MEGGSVPMPSSIRSPGAHGSRPVKCVNWLFTVGFCLLATNERTPRQEKVGPSAQSCKSLSSELVCLPISPNAIFLLLHYYLLKSEVVYTH